MAGTLYLEKFKLQGRDIIIRDPEASHGGEQGLTIEEVINALYPVGSTIMRADAKDPNDYLGVGTWVAVSGGIVITTATSDSTIGQTADAQAITAVPAHNHSFSTGSAGSHTHTASSSSTGNHTHTTTISSSGAHSHSGTANSAGAHNHNLRGYENALTAGSTGYRPGGAGTAHASDIIESAGAHTHSVTIGSSGAHTHTGTNNTTGAHTHTITNQSAGAHTHSGTTNSTGDSNGITLNTANVPRFTVKIWRRTA